MYNYTLVYPTHTPKVFQSTSTFFDLWSTSATLEVKLGQGSFGSVWRAKHRQSGDTAPWPRGKRHWSLAGLRHWIYSLEIWKYNIEKVATNVNRSEKRKEHDYEAMFQFTNQRIVSVLVFLPHIPQPAWDTGSWFLDSYLFHFFWSWRYYLQTDRPMRPTSTHGLRIHQPELVGTVKRQGTSKSEWE